MTTHNSPDDWPAAGQAPSLERIERWMQAVITHPAGVLAGAASEEARRAIDVPPEQLESVVTRSRQLDSRQRLDIYAGAYWARLLECMRDEFPTMVAMLGEEAFNGLAVGYLQACPSQSYTLAQLSARFPQYLADSRPPRQSGPAEADQPDWADLLIDLARLERAINEVFDAPGAEALGPLDEARMRAIPAERWPETRLVPAPGMRLLEFRFPANDCFTAVREGRAPGMPAPKPTWLVLWRRDYVVRRQALSAVQYALLAAINEGRCVADAIAAAADTAQIEPDELADSLFRWFADWTAAGLFCDLVT